MLKNNVIWEAMSRGTTRNKTTLQVQNSATPPSIVDISLNADYIQVTTAAVGVADRRNNRS